LEKLEKSGSQSGASIGAGGRWAKQWKGGPHRPAESKKGGKGKPKNTEIEKLGKKPYRQ